MPTVEFPSGLTADLRKIKGHELIAIAEQQEAQTSDGGFSAILGGCWLHTADPGPYTFVMPGDTKPDFSRMLKGDLIYGFIKLRQISIAEGDDYHFDVHCEECRKRYGWTKKLSELEVKRLPQASADKMRASAAFDAHIRGKLVRFNLQTLSQEAPIAKLAKQQQRVGTTIIDTLAAQIISIEGVKPDLRARWRFLAELDMDELFDLRAQLEAPDCGVDTAIQTQCQQSKCQWVQDIALPFGKSFFAPKKPTKKATQDMLDFSEQSSEGSDGSGSGSAGTTSGGTSTEEAVTS